MSEPRPRILAMPTTYLATVTSDDRTMLFQSLTPDPATGDLYGCQPIKVDGFDHLRISRLVADGFDWHTRDHMWLRPGGHGDHGIRVETLAGEVHITLRVDVLNPDNTRQRTAWVRIPWRGGKTWTTADLLRFPGTAQQTTQPPREPYCQGEVAHNGITYRMHGAPRGKNGQYGDYPDLPGELLVIEGGQVRSTLDLGHIGNGPDGLPVGGRKELEGLAIYRHGRTTFLQIGVAVGWKPNYQHQLHLLPLEHIGDSMWHAKPGTTVTGQGDAGATYVRDDRYTAPIVRRWRDSRGDWWGETVHGVVYPVGIMERGRVQA